ncbi:multisubstrate pseudouridine synthase 7 [Blomia tropicalis]|nr:multisubstrate pseudouridine synthase 7 [Blomia tropicalis]
MATMINKKRKVDYSELIKRGLQTEVNVGITEFIGKQKPFIGIIKHRFEDFVVHEIDQRDNVIRLEDISEPEEIELETKFKETDLKIDSTILENIKSLATNDKSEEICIPVENLDKTDRTKIHCFVRQNYQSHCLDTKTETIDGKIYIKVVKGSNLRGRNNNKKQFRWPKGKPNYIQFVLYKQNMETVQVVNELSRQLRCTTKNFTFAGTKDKRAITTQMFTVWRTNPKKIWNCVNDFNKQNMHKNTFIKVGHFKSVKDSLKLGDLNGNRFEIIMRNVRLVDDSINETNQTEDELLRDEIEQSFLTTKNNGFINYFGMQRFGSHRVDSHKLGILILKKDFKSLVHEILQEKEKDIRPRGKRNEVSFNDAIRLYKETGNAALAYKKMNYKYTIEASLLRALSNVNPNDYHGALCIGLMRNSRLLYIHAYQSYLWNRIASFRIRQYGLQVVVGDLVLLGDLSDNDTFDDYCNDDNDGGDDDSNNGPVNDDTNERIKSNISPDQVILVTESNISQFTIYDVIIPIIGGLSKLPTNSTNDFIQSILLEDGVSIDDFGSLSKQWCVNGSYRKLLVRPKALEWEWLRYSDDTKPLIETDLDRIQNKTITFEDEEPDSKTALKLVVTLPTSSYATMLLREVTKLSSDALEDKPWKQIFVDDSEEN